MSENDSQLRIPSAEFAKTCKELSSLSETLLIRTSGKIFEFSVEGEIGSGKVIFGENDFQRAEETYEIKVNKPVLQ